MPPTTDATVTPTVTPTVIVEDPPMPSISKAIWVTLIQAIIGLLVAFGIDVSQELQDAIVQLVTVLAVAIPAWDAWVRANRARFFAAKASTPAINTNIINPETPAA